MADDKIKMLLATIEKLHRRGALTNIVKILSKTHSADIAEVLQGFSSSERLEIFSLIADTEKKADIISYLKPELQTELLGSLEHTETVSLIQEIDTDDVADIMARLPEDTSQKILADMEKEDSEEVVDLLGYPEDSAGGMMNVEYFALHKELTVEETISKIQQNENHDSILFYIYVINSNEQIIGVLSLKELLLSKKNKTLHDLMNPDVISVSVDTPQEEVAKKVEKYDFLSIPVVEENNKLVGVITVDDVIDVIREEAEEEILSMGQAGFDVDASIWQHFKSRILWILFAFAGGGICFSIVFYFPSFHTLGQPSFSWLVTTALIPLLLALGATTGNQSTAISLGVLRSNRLDKGYFSMFLKKELTLGFIFALILSVSLFVILDSFFEVTDLSKAFSGVLALQVFASMLLGSFLPYAFDRLGVNSSAASQPVLTIVVNIITLLTLFTAFNLV